MKIAIIFLVAVLLVSGCVTPTPSADMVQTAIAATQAIEATIEVAIQQTQTNMPTDTPVATATVLTATWIRLPTATARPSSTVSVRSLLAQQYRMNMAKAVLLCGDGGDLFLVANSKLSDNYALLLDAGWREEANAALTVMQSCVDEFNKPRVINPVVKEADEYLKLAAKEMQAFVTIYGVFLETKNAELVGEAEKHLTQYSEYIEKAYYLLIEIQNESIP